MGHASLPQLPVHTVITENDTSVYEDQTGLLYHFPKRYLPLLTTGSRVVYYKGTLRDAAYRRTRLSDSPHYFGTAVIGRVYADSASGRGYHFAEIENYDPFDRPVLNSIDGEYVELIPESRRANYWRAGVRPIDGATYDRIKALAGLPAEVVREPRGAPPPVLNDVGQGLESGEEGAATRQYVTVYERDSRLRTLAVAIHGLDCQGCGFNFERTYGSHGRAYIHVHHLVPVSELGGRALVAPETDMTVLCPNCHAMVHRHTNRTLSLDALRALTGWLGGQA